MPYTDLTDEEYDALDEELSHTVPKFGPPGSDWLVQRELRQLGRKPDGFRLGSFGEAETPQRKSQTAAPFGSCAISPHGVHCPHEENRAGGFPSAQPETPVSGGPFP